MFVPLMGYPNDSYSIHDIPMVNRILVNIPFSSAVLLHIFFCVHCVHGLDWASSLWVLVLEYSVHHHDTSGMQWLLLASVGILLASESISSGILHSLLIVFLWAYYIQSSSKVVSSLDSDGCVFSSVTDSSSISSVSSAAVSSSMACNVFNANRITDKVSS